MGKLLDIVKGYTKAMNCCDWRACWQAVLDWKVWKVLSDKMNAGKLVIDTITALGGAHILTDWIKYEPARWPICVLVFAFIMLLLYWEHIYGKKRSGNDQGILHSILCGGCTNRHVKQVI